MSTQTASKNRVAWAMRNETAGEFGEVEFGDEGTVVGQDTYQDEPLVVVEWDRARVTCAVPTWMVNWTE